MDEQNQRQQGREERMRCCTEVGVKQLISFGDSKVVKLYWQGNKIQQHTTQFLPFSLPSLHPPPSCGSHYVSPLSFSADCTCYLVVLLLKMCGVLRHCKFKTKPYDLSISHQTSWSLTKPHDLSPSLMISHQTSWSLSKPHDLSPNLMISHQTSWSLSKPHDLSPNLMISLQTSWSFSKPHDLSPNLRISLQTSWSFSKPHDLSPNLTVSPQISH